MIDGLPLGRLETIGVLCVLWLLAHRVRIAGAPAAAVVAIVATIAAATVPGDRGINARYFATASASGAHERSVESRDPDITRIDTRLDFARGERDFPLSFFNDHTRFNFMRMGEPDRRYLEFSAAWSGWLHVPDSDALTYYLRAPQAEASLSIGSTTVLAVTPASAGQTREMSLAEGWHRIHVTFSSPFGAPREFSVGTMNGNEPAPFDATHMRTDRIDERQAIVARVIGTAKNVTDIIALAWLAGLSGLVLMRRLGELWRHRLAARDAALTVFALGGAVEALRFAWPWMTRLRIMTAGDDTMVYEGYARDIVFNGILMNGGLPPGAGEPFYFQALYPYFLAATHLVWGESFFGALFLQRALVFATAVMLTNIAIRLRGDAVWPLALTVAASFALWKQGPIAADMLNESLYVPLLAAWTLALFDVSRRPTPTRAAVTGVLAGLAALTRSTLTLSWPVVWMALAMRASTRRPAMLAVLIASSITVYSTMAIRNRIVSGEFVSGPTGGGITLRQGNELPTGMVIDLSKRKPLYDWLGVTGHTAEVVEYALTAPGQFSANLGRKALFALGFYEPYVEGWGYSPVYIATWVSAVFGLVLLMRSGTPWVPMMLPLLIAITQFIAVVIVYPRGERLILPIHTLLIPYSAVAAHALWQRAASAR